MTWVSNPTVLELARYDPFNSVGPNVTWLPCSKSGAIQYGIVFSLHSINIFFLILFFKSPLIHLKLFYLFKLLITLQVT
jgi:hypothetical protein